MQMDDFVFSNVMDRMLSMMRTLDFDAMTKAISAYKSSNPNWDQDLEAFSWFMAASDAYERYGVKDSMEAFFEYFKDPTKANYDKAFIGLDDLDSGRDDVLSDLGNLYSDMIQHEAPDESESTESEDIPLNDFDKLDWTDMLDYVIDAVGNGNRSVELQEMIKDYEEHNPDLKEKLDAYEDAVRSLDMPDFVKQGYLDLLSYVRHPNEATYGICRHSIGSVLDYDPEF